MSDDWAEAGKRHDTDDGGHWHEPSYPSCVVCRMRDLEEALQFYADPETYIAIGFFPDPPCGEFMDDFGETGTKDYGPRPGERARKALGYDRPAQETVQDRPRDKTDRRHRGHEHV